MRSLPSLPLKRSDPLQSLCRMRLNDPSSQADAIRVKVGYPSSPNTENPESLLRYYTRVNISKFDYFNNMLSARYKIMLTSYIHMLLKHTGQLERRLRRVAAVRKTP
jgi:hypothetical protein